MNKLKRFLALVLAMSMMLTVVPFGAFATESTEQTDVPTESVTEAPESDVEVLADDGTATTSHTDSKPADGTVTGQPFDTTVSANYRIPGLVNHNGTLIASADARWDQEKDGGGMDLVVSRSTDGKTWNYTFAGYLGDNGNVWNNQSSTLMDPVIISDGTTLYLLADMFPAGYSISSSSTANTFSDTAIGFDASGNLLLSGDSRSTYGYYLKDGKIYSTDGTEQTGYTVKGWYDLYLNDVYQTNLFFSDSPFQVRATSYICMSTSTDGGVTWNSPILLNVKPNGTNWMVLGPGSGVVTQDGYIAFTAYDGSNVYLVYGKDGNWSTTVTSAATNESSIIELNDGTIRAFVKRAGSNTIAYVDFTRNDNGSYITYTTDNNLVDTGVANFSQCMVSSLHYSKTLNGKEVVLVCCPSKPGSGDWNGRFNGKIHMFTLDGSNNMTHEGSDALNGESEFFAYSNMAELDNGTVGVLYEDDCISYSAGSYYGNASHITYKNVNLETAFGVTFDVNEVEWTSGEFSGSVVAPYDVTSVYATQATVDSLTTAYVAYDLHLCGTSGCTGVDCTTAYTKSATVTIPLTEELKGVTVKGFVVEEDGTITSIYDVENDGTNVTFEVPHFSVVGVAALAADEVTYTKEVDVTITVGQSETVTIDGYAYSNTDVKAEPNTGVATIGSIAGTTVPGSAETTVSTAKATELENGATYIIRMYDTSYALSNVTGSTAWGTQTLAFQSNNLTANEAHLWTLEAADGGYKLKNVNGYLNLGTGNNTAYLDTTGEVFTFTSTTTGWTICNQSGEYINNLGNSNNAGGWTGDGTRFDLYKVNTVTADPTYFTEITFNGVGVGTTSAVVGDIRFNITVAEDMRDIKLHTKQTATFYIDGVNYTSADVKTSPDSTIAKLDSVVAGNAKLVSVSELVDGEYLIVNAQTGEVLTDTAVTLTGDAGEKSALKTDGTASVNSTELWTIKGDADNGYTVVQDGKFLTVAGYYAAMSDTETALKLTYSNSGWMICDDTTWESLGHDDADFYLRNGIADANYTTEALGSSITSSYSYWLIYKIDATPVTEVTFTGVSAGTTTAVVGNVTFSITVDNVVEGDIEDFTNIVGVDQYSDDNANTSYRSDLDMAGKMITSLRITEGASFHLGVDVTDYTSVTWSIADSNIATVDADGYVTAKAAGTTKVTATVVKDGKEESISIPVTVVPSLVEGYADSEITSIFYYIEQVDDTDPYYTMFLNTESTTGPVEGHRLIKVSEGEVIWYERPTNSAFAWVWTADPWEGYALTKMGSTGSIDEYYPLRNPDDITQLGDGYVDVNADGSFTDGTDSEYYYTSATFSSNGAPNNAYKNVVLVGNDGSASWRDALNDLLKESILIGQNIWPNYGCDGAMSNTRWDHDGVPKLVTAMTFISNPMPKITKSVNGILPTTKLRKDFRTYRDGMTATVGEYVYFQIDITLDRPTVWADEANGIGAITYSDAIVSDTVLPDAYFYVQATDTNNNGVIDESEGEQLQTEDITARLNAAWGTEEKTRTISLYLVYEIQPNDIPKFNITNTAGLTWDYKSHYSTGALAGEAEAEATITVVGRSIDDVVVDFGQSITYTGLTMEQLKYAYVGDAVKYKAEYGTVTVTGGGTEYTDTIGTYYTEYTVTYTPTSIMQGYDIVYIYGSADNGTDAKIINSFVVYPATSVYYEEGFILKENNGWSTGAMATKDQTLEKLSMAAYDDNNTLTGYVSDKKYPYGYDPIYNGDGTNDVAESYTSSSKVGDTASFQFTGTGFELYANSTADTGRVAVSVYDSDDELVQMYVVNTVAKDGSTTATTGQSVALDSLPIVSVKDLTHGTYTVTLNKVVMDDKVSQTSKTVYIDGVRIINTLADSSLFEIDLEDKPEFYQLRDYVLKAVGVDDVENSIYVGTGVIPSISEIADQIYAGISTDGEAPAAVITSGTGTYGDVNVQDLLDNGPKNELYLHKDQTLTFKVTTERLMQIGLKAPAGATSYSITGATTNGISGNLATSVDMFYELGNTRGTSTTYTITVTNTGSNILSVTDLKICDDPNAVFVPLTVEDIESTLVTMGYGETAVAENATTGATYATLSEALSAAQEGDTIKLLADTTEGNLMVTAGVTLDLNGFNLTVSNIVAFKGNHVIDSVGTGSLITGESTLILAEDNAMIPFYTGSGYIFSTVGFAIRMDEGYTGNGVKINAMAYPKNMEAVQLLKDGGEDNKIEIMIRLTWDTDQGTGSQEFTFLDRIVSEVYTSNQGSWSKYGKMFTMTITGCENISNLKANVVIKSGTNVVRVNPTSLTITE